MSEAFKTKMISMKTAKPDNTMLVEMLKNATYFRQSFLGDYAVCPKMAYYRWIEESDLESKSFFAGHLGTAGHEVIFRMHEDKAFDMDQSAMSDMFEKFFWKSFNSSPAPPSIGKKYESARDQLLANMPDYIEMIDSYRIHKRNQTFISMLHEQRFTLVVYRDYKNSNGQTENRRYIFTGTIDQAGFYEDGTFSVRDIKFRDKAYKPSYFDLSLNMQLTIYAAALALGNPSCRSCSPRYEENFASGGRDLVYNGPCESCQEIAQNDSRWPKKFPNICEMIWMRDFEVYARDEYARTIVDKDAPKVKNPKTGRLVYQERPNPNWEKGYKRGDRKGDCFLPSYREPAKINALFQDILDMCDGILRGDFYRRPGSHCSNWCSYQQQCTSQIKSLVTEEKLRASMMFSSSTDPFAE